MIAASRASRRELVAVSASALAAGALFHAVPVGAIQVDRDLLDLLHGQEVIQIAHYKALLAAFDETAFQAAGLPEGARGAIERILVAEEAHLEALVRPDGESVLAQPTPVLSDLVEALRGAAELEDLAVASYALVIPELERRRLVPALVGIHSVEARHAAWLATLLGNDPFPNDIDVALTLDEPASEPIATVPATSGAGTPTIPPDMAPVIAAIANDLGIAPESVQVTEVERVDWPDSLAWMPTTGHALCASRHTRLRNSGRSFWRADRIPRR